MLPPAGFVGNRRARPLESTHSRVRRPAESMVAFHRRTNSPAKTKLRIAIVDDEANGLARESALLATLVAA
jgi:hypothetical protein